MDKTDLNELRTDQSKTFLNKKIRMCSKFNRTTLNQEEICPPDVSNDPHWCFSVWELEEDVKKYNLTETIKNSILSLKGCWVGHKLKESHCAFTIKPKRTIICYCSGYNCNNSDLPPPDLIKLDYPPQNNSSNSNISSKTNNQLSTNHCYLLIYLFPVLILLALTFLFFYKQRNKLKKKFNCMNQSINAIKQSHLNGNDVNEPLLYKSGPRIIEHLKQGQYCNVYKGKIERRVSTEQLTIANPGQMMLDLEQSVAIKAYSQQMYDSFKHEYSVYSLPQLKHENILKFINAEEKRTSNSPPTFEYWLVLEYHEHGSLYDYLKRNLITYSQLLQICLNIATGLSHLHNNYSCVVVHRDLKSKNVLLKSDLTACISDFNLALVLYPNQPANENLDQVGTVRYMSPEVLDCAIQFSKECLTKIDIYSTALIFWEVLSRCSAQLGPVEPYSMPYEKELGPFLIKEELRKHVSENKRRPEIPDHWCDHSDLKEFAKTINESWDQDAEARLSAAGIVERLKRIKEKNESNKI